MNDLTIEEICYRYFRTPEQKLEPDFVKAVRERANQGPEWGDVGLENLQAIEKMFAEES